MQEATLEPSALLYLERGAKRTVKRPLPYQVNDGNSKALGPTLGYRQCEAVKPHAAEELGSHCQFRVHYWSEVAFDYFVFSLFCICNLPVFLGGQPIILRMPLRLHDQVETCSPP